MTSSLEHRWSAFEEFFAKRFAAELKKLGWLVATGERLDAARELQTQKSFAFCRESSVLQAPQQVASKLLATSQGSFVVWTKPGASNSVSQEALSQKWDGALFEEKIAELCGVAAQVASGMGLELYSGNVDINTGTQGFELLSGSSAKQFCFRVPGLSYLPTFWELENALCKDSKVTASSPYASRVLDELSRAVELANATGWGPSTWVKWARDVSQVKPKVAVLNAHGFGGESFANELCGEHFERCDMETGADFFAVVDAASDHLRGVYFFSTPKDAQEFQQQRAVTGVGATEAERGGAVWHTQVAWVTMGTQGLPVLRPWKSLQTFRFREPGDEGEFTPGMGAWCQDAGTSESALNTPLKDSLGDRLFCSGVPVSAMVFLASASGEKNSPSMWSGINVLEWKTLAQTLRFGFGLREVLHPGSEWFKSSQASPICSVSLTLLTSSKIGLGKRLAPWTPEPPVQLDFWLGSSGFGKNEAWILTASGENLVAAGDALFGAWTESPWKRGSVEIEWRPDVLP